jgi:predicted nucleotide-binding protein
MSDRPPTKLLVPREKAKENITELIKEAEQILKSARRIWAPTPEALFSPETAEFRAEADREKWAEYTYHLLKTLFTDDSIARKFGDTWLTYSHGSNKNQQLEDWIKAKIVRLESVVRQLPLFLIAEKPVQATAVSSPSRQQSKKIFIVHGHDEAAKQAVARVIEKLELHAVILHEQPDRGRTIIEKFERHSDVGFAVVLLTPDDVGYAKDEAAKAQPRPRQNVVLELGYFIGKLGRASVCALLKGDIDIEFPTDFAGVLYTPMDDAGAWKLKLAREIKESGIDVDLNKLA